MGKQNKKFPLFCFCCGEKVRPSDKLCPNEECEARLDNEKFCSRGKYYCVYCEDFPKGLTAKSKTCPTCSHKLNAAIVNPYKKVVH